jgi:two-component system, NarL family, sensor histidine kinase UhpB
MTTSAFSDTIIIAGPRPEQRLGVLRSLWSRSLRLPLLGKLIGANLLIVLAELAAHFAFPAAPMALQLSVALALGFAVTGGLAWLALRPIAQLQATAQQVAGGDFKARAPASPLADRDVEGLTVTMNRLLDRVEADRARIQYLAGRSVRARDIERESVARELRDSVAQTVAAVGLQIAAAQRVNSAPEVEQQLERARSLVQQLTEDMRSVADTLYPGTLGEFGLLNALNALVRRTGRRTSTHLEVDGSSFRASDLSVQTASALYRVADEALRNIAQHADATHARVTLQSANGEVTLVIEDDGRGVDMRSSDPLHAGLGLFSAKVVLALTGGELQISSAPNAGTRIIARVPASTTPRDS